MATDIAFAMGVFNFFKSKMPAGASAFLLTLATVDDLGAIAVIAFCFARNVQVSRLFV
jgi:NhaA family Na+:H+ antiporter